MCQINTEKTNKTSLKMCLQLTLKKKKGRSAFSHEEEKTSGRVVTVAN